MKSSFTNDAVFNSTEILFYTFAQSIHPLNGGNKIVCKKAFVENIKI